MSKIIGFLSQKGGVGKSVCTAIAANTLSQNPFNHSVFVADLDKQRSLAMQRNDDLRVFDGASPYPIQALTITDFLNERTGIYDLDKRFDFVFVDVAGKLDNDLEPDQQEIVKYLQMLDFLFIPFVAGAFGMNATLGFLRIALKVQQKRSKNQRPLHVFGFVNMAEPTTIDNKIIKEEIEELQAAANINFMQNNLNRYALFRATDTLTTIYEQNPKGRAEKNLKAWFDEMYNIIM